ncbi:DKNYY domain-containing protein [Halpernia sp. GG3]
MKLFKLFFLSLILTSLFSCKKGYEKENGKVYYEHWNEGSAQNKKLMKNVDFKTFKEIEFKDKTSFSFAKDKNHLFIDGDIMKNIDPETFTFINNYYFKDKNKIYFFGFFNDINDCSVKGIDSNHFQTLKYPWAKSGKILINGQESVFVDDIDSFKPIDEDWGKTNKYIINRNVILKNANPKTTKILSSYEAIDGNKKYKYGIMEK